MTAAGAILVAVITTVLSTVVVARLTGPPTPTFPTSTRVTEVPASIGAGSPSATATPSSSSSSSSSARSVGTVYGGPRGTGWAVVPITSRNDYVSVTVSMDPSDQCHGATSWVFRQSAGRLAPLAELPTREADDTWATANGGVPQSGNHLTMTVQAVDHHTVVISDFGVLVVHRSPPPGGTAATLGGGCGGLIPSYFDANLDAADPEAKPVAGRDAAGRVAPAVAMPHSVSDATPEVWLLRVLTTTCTCQYLPYFDWVSDGNSGRYVVALHGQPWEVAAVTRAHRASPDGEAGRWLPY